MLAVIAINDRREYLAFAALIALPVEQLTRGLSHANVLAPLPFVAGEDRVIGPLGTANYEIREAERRDEQRRRARLSEPRRLTDQLLEQLEELNLDGVRIVPGSYDPGLAEIRSHLVGCPGIGTRLLERLQSGTRTAELIETVFTIQEYIAPPTAVIFEEPGLV
jgi:hypothetical protein